jgi:dihydroflavonol-4-reductase
MTAAVTGATGHLGANLVRALLAKNRPVRCLVHVNTAPLDGLDVELFHGDIADVASLVDAFRGTDVVYHLAAAISLSMRDWPKLEAINVTGTRNVIEACRRAGVRRLVHFSSIHALVQEPLSVPVDEARALVCKKSCPPYDLSKAAAETLVRQAVAQGLDAVVVNPTGVIGPYDFEPSHMGEAILSMAQNRLPALVGGGFDWVDARDVAAGAIAAADRAPSGAGYLLSGHWVSVCDIAGMISQFTHAAEKRFVCPLWLARLSAPVIESAGRWRGKRPLYTRVSLRNLNGNRNISHARATRELGFQPRPFRETLEDTLRWFVAAGRLELPRNSGKDVP